MREVGVDAKFTITSWLTLSGPMTPRSVMVAKTPFEVAYCVMDTLEVLDEKTVNEIRSERRVLRSLMAHEIKYPHHHWVGGKVPHYFPRKKKTKKRRVLRLKRR